MILAQLISPAGLMIYSVAAADNKYFHKVRESVQSLALLYTLSSSAAQRDGQTGASAILPSAL